MMLNELLLPPHLSPHKAINILPSTLKRDKSIDAKDLIPEDDDEDLSLKRGKKFIRRA